MSEEDIKFLRKEVADMWTDTSALFVQLIDRYETQKAEIERLKKVIMVLEKGAY